MLHGKGFIGAHRPMAVASLGIRYESGGQEFESLRARQ